MCKYSCDVAMVTAWCDGGATDYYLSESVLG